jgi:Putative peptidoglycan binding domain
LDLALARIKDNLGQLRGPIQRSAQQTLSRRIAGRAKIAHLRYALGAVLSLALVGIAVNALLLQRERHPAPLFAPSPAKPPAAISAPPPLAPPPKPVAAEHDSAPAQPSTALPPARPAETSKSAAPAPDPIAQLLAAETHDDASHLTLAAQTALAKLGYSVKPDGKEGAATEQALRDFEHAHGLPPATEITARLVKELNQAAREAGR